MTKACPSRDELSGYVLGRLPSPQADAVTEHLAACPNCEETLHDLAATSDSLIDQIKAAPAAEAYVDEPACLKVVSAIERQAAAGGTVPTPTPAQQAAPSAGPQQVRPMNRTDFVEFLTTTGFVSAGELTALEKQLPPAEATDVQVLARVLVQQGKLTKYQAAAVYQGKGKSLIFGEHVVIDRIGAGGMGQVFKAKHRRMDRIVAIKVMSAAAMKNADSVKRFEREVRAAAKLAHPNIVHANDAGVQDGVHFLVMEFVDGPDLSSLLKKQGKLPIKQACDFITQAARGFAFAHGKGVIHRDIKPGNLLVDGEGTIKILDMGLARFDDAGVGGIMTEAELTQSGAVMGTVDYMAPEQAMNTRHADAKSDVYGLGCTLYRLVTGEAVYAGQTMVEKIFAHKEQPIPSLRQHRPDAPPALESLVTRMLAKDPAQRPTMQEVAEGLTLLTQGEPGASATGGSGIGVRGQGSGIGLPAARAIPVASAAAGFGSPRPGTPGIGAGGEGPAVRSVAAPPRRKSKLPLLAAAGAGAILVALGIWLVIRDKDGKEVARVNVPDGNSVEVIPAVPIATPSATPSATAPSAPAVAFTLPTATPSASAAPFAPPPPHVASVPPKVIAPPTDSVSTTGWIDLLPLVDPTQDVVSGTWVKQNGELAIDAAKTDRIVVPVQPTGSYDAEYDFTRTGGTENVAFFLPVGRKETVYMLSANLRYNGLLWLDGGRATDNATQNFDLIDNGRRHKMAFEVRVSGTQAHLVGKLDGKEILNWRGEQSQLGTDADSTRGEHTWRMPQPLVLGLGVHKSQATFHSAKLRLVDGTLQPTRAGVTLPATTTPASAPVAAANPSVATPGALAPVVSNTATPLCEVLTGDKMSGVAAEVLTFYGPQIAGRRRGRGMVVNAPATWQTEGTVWTCTFANRNGSGVQFVHPFKNGHVRIHLMMLPNPALFNDGAFHITDPAKPHEEVSTYPYTALRKKFPLTERAYPVVSKLDASGRYELWLDYVLTLTAQFDSAEPLRMKPPFVDEAAPAVLAPGQAAVIANGPGNGHNEARNVFLSTTRNPVLPSLPTVNFPAPTETDPERRAIEWARARGAKLSLEGALGAGVALPSGGGLPAEPFTTRIIDFREVSTEFRRGIGDADMQYLAGLKGIGNLRLPFSQLTDAGMQPISTLTTLYTLDLSEAHITDAGIQALGTLPKLRNLYLDGTNITDRGLAFIAAQFPALNETLKLDYTQVTDEGIQILGTMTHLRGVSLNGTRVTMAGIERLKAAKPNLGITWNPDAPRFVPSQFAGAPVAPPLSVAAVVPLTTSPVPATPAAAAVTVDLLALVQLPRDIVAGTWQRVGNELTGGGGNNQRVQIPYTPPEEYDFVVRAKYTGNPSDVTGLMAGLVAHGRQFFVTVRPDMIGISVNGFVVNDYKAAGLTLPLVQPFEVVHSVRKGSVATSVNGSQLFRFAGDFNQLGLASNMTMPAKNQLFVGSGGAGTWAISSIRLIPVSASSPRAVATTAPISYTPSAPAADVVVVRQPVPDKAAQQTSLATIKDVFKDDYAAAKTPEQKAELGAKLVDQAKQTVNDPAARYVLLTEGRALAIEGVRAEVLRDALLLLTREYDVDEVATFVDSWNELLKRPRVDPSTIKLLFDESSGLFDEAVKDARFDDAKRYGDFALSTSRRLPNSAAIVKSATERNTALVARQKEWDAVKAAAEKIAATPDDAEANLALGRYVATVVGDWGGALAMLAKGNDEVLKSLAEKSIATTPGDAAAQVATGDAWWDAAQAAKAQQRSELLAGAHFWYSLANPALSGLAKARVEKRMTDTSAALPTKKIPATNLPAVLASASSSPAPDALNQGVVPTRGFGDTKPATPVIPPSAPANPAALPAPAGAITQRAFVERLLANRAVINVVEPGGAAKTLKVVSDLPVGDFDIVQITSNYSEGMVDADLQIFGSLKKLRRLQIQNSQITGSGLVFLKELPELEFLGINRCPLSDAALAHLGGMKNLKELDIPYTPISDAGLVHLQNQPQLTHLGLGHTKVTDAGMQIVAKLTKLESIKLDSTSAGDVAIEHIANLSELRVLGLSNTRITDRSAPMLAKFTKLQQLSVQGTGVSPTAVDALKKSLPNCKITNAP